jgi:hypothetical protein
MAVCEQDRSSASAYSTAPAASSRSPATAPDVAIGAAMKQPRETASTHGPVTPEPVVAGPWPLSPTTSNAAALAVALVCVGDCASRSATSAFVGSLFEWWDFSTVPPYRAISVRNRSKRTLKSAGTSSGSRCSDSEVNPTRSANKTDTNRRSDTSADVPPADGDTAAPDAGQARASATEIRRQPKAAANDAPHTHRRSFGQPHAQHHTTSTATPTPTRTPCRTARSPYSPIDRPDRPPTLLAAKEATGYPQTIRNAPRRPARNTHHPGHISAGLRNGNP